PCLCSFPQGLTHIYPHFHSLTLSLSLKVSLCLSLTFLSIGPCPWNKSSLFFSDTFPRLLLMQYNPQVPTPPFQTPLRHTPTHTHKHTHHHSLPYMCTS